MQRSHWLTGSESCHRIFNREFSPSPSDRVSVPTAAVGHGRHPVVTSPARRREATDVGCLLDALGRGGDGRRSMQTMKSFVGGTDSMVASSSSQGLFIAWCRRSRHRRRLPSAPRGRRATAACERKLPHPAQAGRTVRPPPDGPCPCTVGDPEALRACARGGGWAQRGTGAEETTDVNGNGPSSVPPSCPFTRTSAGSWSTGARRCGHGRRGRPYQRLAEGGPRRQRAAGGLSRSGLCPTREVLTRWSNRVPPQRRRRQGHRTAVIGSSHGTRSGAPQRART